MMITRTGEATRWGDHSTGEGKGRCQVLQGRATQAGRQGLRGVSGEGTQVRPHLCPLGIVPLMDGHRRGLEGGQDNVVVRHQMDSDVVRTATVCSGSEPGGGWGSGLCTPGKKVALEAGRQQTQRLEL